MNGSEKTKSTVYKEINERELDTRDKRSIIANRMQSIAASASLRAYTLEGEALQTLYEKVIKLEKLNSFSDDIFLQFANEIKPMLESYTVNYPRETEPPPRVVIDIHHYLSSTEAASLLGKVANTIKTMIHSKRLIGFKENGTFRVPAWQFANNKVVIGLDMVLRIVGDEGLEAAEALTLPLEKYSGKRMIDALHEGNVSLACEMAQHFIE